MKNDSQSEIGRVVIQLRQWEQAALERSQDPAGKTEEQAYHLGKKDAYEAARLAIERGHSSSDTRLHSGHNQQSPAQTNPQPQYSQ